MIGIIVSEFDVVEKSHYKDSGPTATAFRRKTGAPITKPIQTGLLHC